MCILCVSVGGSFFFLPLILNVVQHLTVTLHFKMYKTGISRLDGGKQLSEDLSETKKWVSSFTLIHFKSRQNSTSLWHGL